MHWWCFVIINSGQIYLFTRRPDSGRPCSANASQNPCIQRTAIVDYMASTVLIGTNVSKD